MFWRAVWNLCVSRNWLAWWREIVFPSLKYCFMTLISSPAHCRRRFGVDGLSSLCCCLPSNWIRSYVRVRVIGYVLFWCPFRKKMSILQCPFGYVKKASGFPSFFWKFWESFFQNSYPFFGYKCPLTSAVSFLKTYLRCDFFRIPSVLFIQSCVFSHAILFVSVLSLPSGESLFSIKYDICLPVHIFETSVPIEFLFL